VKNVLNGNEQAIKESQSFGLMWSNVGLPLSVFTVIIFPISVCYFCLIYVAPSAEAGGMWGKWVVSSAVRWGLLFAIGVISTTVVTIQCSVVSIINKREKSE
jgi:uncharacterized membrane protein (DUF485 family)